MRHGNGLRLPRRNLAKSAASTQFIAIGTLTGVASSFLRLSSPGMRQQATQSAPQPGGMATAVAERK
jgi:hypothetical protein